MAVLFWYHLDGNVRAETFIDNRPAELTFPKNWPDECPGEHTDTWFWLMDSGYADHPCSERQLDDGRIEQRIPHQRWPSL